MQQPLVDVVHSSPWLCCVLRLLPVLLLLLLLLLLMSTGWIDGCMLGWDGMTLCPARPSIHPSIDPPTIHQSTIHPPSHPLCETKPRARATRMQFPGAQAPMRGRLQQHKSHTDTAGLHSGICGICGGMCGLQVRVRGQKCSIEI